MDPKTWDFDDADGDFMKEMQEQYLENIDEKLGLLKQSLEAVKENRTEKPLQYTAYRLAHSMAGGAASFNFWPATDIGRCMESILDKAYNNDMPLSDGHLTYLDDLFALLTQYFAAAVAGDVKAKVDLPDLKTYISAAEYQQLHD